MFCSYIEPGSKSGAGLDDGSISSDDSVLLSAKAPSSKHEGRGTAKSEFEVHVYVQTDSANYVLFF